MGHCPVWEKSSVLFFFFSSSVLPRTQGDIYGAGSWVFYGVSCIVKPNTGYRRGSGEGKEKESADGTWFFCINTGTQGKQAYPDGREGEQLGKCVRQGDGGGTGRTCTAGSGTEYPE